MEEQNKIYIDENDMFEEVENDSFDEVLDLTNIDISESVEITNFSGGAGLANIDYNHIDAVSITEKQTKIASQFVKDVGNFIKKQTDVTLSKAHRDYIDAVSNLKLTTLTEMLVMRDMNKELLYNVMHQINYSKGEDFVLINNYNTLLASQMKLIKETNSLINSIPNEIKNLRNDILSNKELMDADKEDLDIISPNENVFNSSKSLLERIEEEERKSKRN